MKYKNITSSLGSFILAVIFISFASGDVIKHVQDKATLLKVKTDPSGSVVFFGHSSDQPGLLRYNLLGLACVNAMSKL